MPPNFYSRHRFTQAYKDANDVLFLSDRVRFPYVNLADNRQHVVLEGDTLWALAAKFFGSFPRPAGLWWIIADFQPDPIHDPTIALTPGSVLVIPSTRTVQERILNERRKQTDNA